MNELIKIKVGFRNRVNPFRRSSGNLVESLVFKSSDGIAQSWGGGIRLTRSPYKRVTFAGRPGSNSLARDEFPGPSAYVWGV